MLNKSVSFDYQQKSKYARINKSFAEDCIEALADFTVQPHNFSTENLQRGILLFKKHHCYYMIRITSYKIAAIGQLEWIENMLNFFLKSTRKTGGEEYSFNA